MLLGTAAQRASRIIASHSLLWEGMGPTNKINKLPLINIIKSVILLGSFLYDTKVISAMNEMAATGPDANETAVEHAA